MDRDDKKWNAHSMTSVLGDSSHPAVHTDIGIRTVYATDNSIYQLLPAAVALPGTAREVQEIMQRNASSAQPLPLVARGGGTGTNGQSLTSGLVLEVKRKLNRILEISPEELTARVEPGVVAGELNAKLKAHNLFWAPHTSTLNRATVGGMISTDAAGKGSLIHGRAHRHVISLKVVLADGTPWIAEPVTIAEAESRALVDDPGGRLWRRLLDLPIATDQVFDLPELARGFSGYGVDRFRRDGLIDPVALLCGAEGTLAVITEATIALTPLPHETTLFVASYRSFRDALDDAVELRETGPTAIECFDETTLERGRSSPAWSALGSVLGDHDGAVLLLEYSGDELPEPGPILASLAATGRSVDVGELSKPADQAQAWKVRADAVGLLAKVATGGPDRSARPTAFVEDCVVPVEQMGSFIDGFRNVLDHAGVLYAMFGHADVGCVHVRPALDITDPDHEALVASITNQVVALAAAHGGVLWGEHGRGFRGESVDEFLSPDVVALMREIKEAFDPRDLLNPGKLYRPSSETAALVGVSEPPLRGQLDRDVPVELRRRFDHAYACNGNGLCHHYDGAEVMCPSYKATGDPALSPRGRADLLRAWLRARELRKAGRGDDTGADELAAELATNMGQCLSCSACTGRCPVEVNIPELKSQFLEEYYATRRRPLSHQLLSRFEEMAVLAARVPAVSRMLAPLGGRAVGLVDLPGPPSVRPAKSDFAVPFDPDATGADRVVLLPEIFSSVLDPSVEVAATRALESVGYRVQRATLVPSGKFDHVKGKRAAFARAAQRQAQQVERIVAAGATPVVIEPAVALMFGEEYPTAYADGPWTHVAHLVDLLAERIDRLTPTSNPRNLTFLPHCTEQATRPSSVQNWILVLKAAGHAVTVANVGCCGMAGIFGHEAENQVMSRQLWDLSWSAPVYAASVPVATGYSCRSQAKRMGESRMLHPVEVWAEGV